ncbi:hypothetical protein MKZ38_002544 [Zalerion maritima]|uniref:Cation-transporting ATPase n=1 Tax=Zalerion maritima TaxID=339359 RepID=A0AAD5RQB9_9PEZI|nr:hypothetical protein MKZ38_002544 [Zalerion maritima]
MEQSGPPRPNGMRADARHNHEAEDANGEHTSSIYGLGLNRSTSSIFEDVEMAHDELFSGPMAESLPTSTSAFAHQRQRSDSVTTFSYYDEDQDPESPDDDAYLSDFSAAHFPPHAQDWEQQDGDAQFDDSFEDESEESGLPSRRQSINNYDPNRRSSLLSRGSVQARLLRRDSLISSTSAGVDGRKSQKVYMSSDDFTIVIAGFRTDRLRSVLYNMLCISSVGTAYLLFRWLPRWRIRFLGVKSPLYECKWVAVENQWGEVSTLDVRDIAYGKPLSSVFGPANKEYRPLEYSADPELDRLRMIDYRYVRLCYHPVKDKFILSNGWEDPSWTSVMAIKAGLEGEEKSFRELVFGQNLIDIEQKTGFQLLVDEVLHPFYIFQLASLILWCSDEYYYYAICIFVISVGSIIATLIETRSTMKRLREISRFECDVRVLRSGFWLSISSSDVVPGDIYELSDPNLALFPSDSLLLSGDCIVNESMLTGESVPVSKTPVEDKILGQLELGSSAISPHVAKHFLFCGTKIIRVRRPQEDRHGEALALAMVVRTGFNTTKGALVRSMLFPKPSGFKFYRDSFRYISVMAGVALVGFIVSLVNFVRLQLAWHLVVVRALDLITIIVPPALPATLTIGTNFALSRLRKKQIFCISPQRVNVGGKVNMMCFDKTGTLTEDGLDILGVRAALRSSSRFSEVIDNPTSLADIGSKDVRSFEDVKVRVALLHTMATCHSLRLVDKELMGDPLDLKMFEFTEWTFEEGASSTRDGEDDDNRGLAPSVARPPPTIQYTLDRKGDIQAQTHSLELGVLRAFEFVSQLRRASVIVRSFGGQSGDIYVKGAPECMRDICRPETFPADYDELLGYYTHKGYRVIGCATRHIKKLSWVKAQKMKRDEAESELDFVGFIIFENKLKPTTTPVIEELRRSNISTAMCTGDNILTAISVARECGLIDKTAHCFVPHFAQGDSRDKYAELKWESIDNSGFQLDPKTLTPLPPSADADASLPYDIIDIRNYTLAVTGDVFRWVIDYADEECLKRMLVCGRVFARMSPDEKHELVEKLQSIGYCCGFCGDGANDCGALKAADIGISLSEAEASVAAPFTSRVFDIRCVPTVIREGRAALVTSFSCFKYMSLYSAIQFTSVSFLYAWASNLGDFQFLFIDLLLILPIAIFMSWARPFPKLSKKRPTANLVSRKVLTPLLGQMAICIAIQAMAWSAVRRQPWYIPPRVNREMSSIKNSENTVLFLVSCFEYILSGVVLNAGPPFRQSMFRNWPFVATILVTVAFTSYMVVQPFHGLRKLMQLTNMTMDFKGYILGMGAAYLVIAWTAEKLLFLRLAKWIGKMKIKVRGKPKQRKEFKEIEERVRASM